MTKIVILTRKRQMAFMPKDDNFKTMPLFMKPPLNINVFVITLMRLLTILLYLTLVGARGRRPL
jgi:hypothetical protein